MTPADFAPAASKKALLRMCAALCAAVLAISLLPQLATAAPAGFSFQMTPQTAGNTAAMSGQRVVFDGAAPSGATGIQSGEWVALDAGGQEIAVADANKEYVPSGALNAVGVEGVTQNDFIRIENGSFVGQLTLPACTYSDPANGCAPEGVRNAVLRLTVATAGGSTAGDSTPVPVDYTRPRIARFDVIDTDRIRVAFTEAVRMPPGQVELATDWLVDDVPGVAAVEGSAGDCQHSTSAAPAADGCTRTLVLTQPVGEDETPMVEYINSLSAFPNRIPYIDAAGLRLQGAIGFGATESIDRIRPAKPNIATVAAKTPSGGEVVSSVSQPTVVLTNLTAGHSVALSFTRNGTTTTMDAVEVPPGANSVELTPTLPADGSYVLSAVATDGAGNTSDQQDKSAARGDGNSTVTYVLDTVAPKIDSAHFVNRKTVTIKFTEPVAPAKNAGQWMIGEDPAEASGEGATRELTAQVDTTSGAGVTWSPTNGSTYTDRAENAMVAVEGFPLSDLPAVPAPTVTTPERQLATTASKVTIAGTAPSDNEYLVAELFERNGETPLAEASAADGSWTFEHTVPAEQRTQLQVRLRDTKTFVTSPRVDVADIVHDTKAPTVDVRLPAGPDLLGDPEQFGVGDSVTITWTATDQANDPQDPDHSRAASIFVVADGVATRIAHGIVAKPGTEQEFTYVLKSSDLGGKRVRDVSFRVDVADDAGNTGDDMSGIIRVLVSTTVAAPAVTTPTQEVFTSGAGVTISGTSPADSETNEYLDAQLFETGGNTPLATTSAAGGSWTFEHTPAKDQRNELQVRLRDRDTGITSRLVSVPDIVHDATAPVVDVRLPASADLLGRPQEFGVGDVVTITWVATDKANDAKQPDHSKTASVFKVAGSSSTAIKTGIVAQPGQEQTVTYTLTESDLGGQGLRDLTFRVDVTDRANNIGSDVSATIRLLGDRVGYTPVLIAPDTLEVRFAEQLQGTSAPGDWSVDGKPVLAEPPADRLGTTVVVLHTPLETDPNATPAVQFTPTLPATQRLRSMNDSQITLASRTAIDRTLPALKVERPDTPDVIDADRIRFTGTTDVTDRPNTIVAYYADAAGNRRASAVASGAAGKDGAWQLRVPLVANRQNRIVFRAVDPSNNRSGVAPVPHFSVIEDSIHPVVTSLTPRSGATVGPTTTIRWKTAEANRSFARLQYRLRSATTWKTIASKTSDDGFYRWTTPRTLAGRVFLLRVASFDKTGKRDALTSSGLRADFVRPEIRFARTIAPKKVRVVFTEAVRPTRARDFTVDGRAVRRMRGSGKARTLVLYRAMTRTTPIVAYDGRITTDRVGNVMRAGQEQALRGFAFPVTDFDAKRVSPRLVRLTWDDDRNRPVHLRSYRIFRDGRRIATVGRSVRSFRERITGSHLYAIRAVDNRGRVSTVRANRVR